MCAGLSPPLSTQPLHYGGQGQRYKGPWETLLHTNQYVLLWDVMGHKAQPSEPLLGPGGSRAAEGAPGLGLAGLGLLPAPARP